MSLLDFQVESGQEPEVFSGTIADDAQAVGDPVRVVIPVFDLELAHGPCPWQPVVTALGVFYPKRGDVCQIARSLDGDPWVVGWTPTASVPDEPAPKIPAILTQTGTLAAQTTINSATETTLVSLTSLTPGTYFAIGQVDWLSVPSGSTFGVYLYVDNSRKSRLYVAGAISRSGLTVAWAGSVTGTIDLRAARPSGTGSADVSTASRLTILSLG